MIKTSSATCRRLFSCPALSLILIFSGCTSLGYRHVPPDQFNYNEAISRSTKEQLLLNLVRLRFFEIPVFLSVNSVTTQYTYAGELGVTGESLFDSSHSLEGGGAIKYTERPTISYLPIEGKKFARRMLTPIPVDIFFALGQSGWPVDNFMLIGLQRINGIENMSFGAVPAPGDLEGIGQMDKDIQKFENFRKVIILMLKLFDLDLLELQHRAQTKAGRQQAETIPYLVFVPPRTAKDREWVTEFRTALELDPGQSEFRVTDRLTGRDKDEITIQTRSLLAIMSFLSRGVQVPKQIQDAGWVVRWEEAAKAWETRSGNPDSKLSLPMKIQSSDTRPSEAFVAVASHGSWFFIHNADIQSKRVFSLLALLFRLLSPGGKGDAPVLTLPAGP